MPIPLAPVVQEYQEPLTQQAEVTLGTEIEPQKDKVKTKKKANRKITFELDGCLFYSLVNTATLAASTGISIIEARRETIKQWKTLSKQARLPYDEMALKEQNEVLNEIPKKAKPKRKQVQEDELKKPKMPLSPYMIFS